MTEPCQHVVKPTKPRKNLDTGLWEYGRAVCSKCESDLGKYCAQTVSSVCPGHKIGETLPYDACVACTAPKPTLVDKPEIMDPELIALLDSLWED